MIKDMNQPNHYAKNSVLIMPIDLLRHLRGNASNALKYLIRCKDKNSEVEDIKKAIDYLTDIVNDDYSTTNCYLDYINNITQTKFYMAYLYYSFINGYIRTFFSDIDYDEDGIKVIYSKESAQKVIDMLKTDYEIED